MSQLKRPDSVTNIWINITGLCCMVFAFSICLNMQINKIYAIFICIIAYAGPIVLLEIKLLKTPYRTSTGLTPAKHKIDLRRVFTKLCALYFTVIIILFLYWLIPEYNHKAYKAYWVFLKYLVMIGSILAIPYFIYVDSKSEDPYDAYWIIGKLICFKSKHIDSIDLKTKRLLITQYILAWLVKGFFAPIIVMCLASNIKRLYKTNFSDSIVNMTNFFETSVLLLCSIDLLIALTGYLFTIKLFDAHNRSTDATCFGWVVCLLCYSPFNDVLTPLYFSTEGNSNLWLSWLTNDYLIAGWCFLVLALLSIYVLATIAFGIRFSNLTHRGIITNGVYRYTKHPAYLAKNAFWWLTTIPFVYLVSDPILSIKAIMFACCESVIYYLRAKTEEAHLMKDPLYQQYALWIDEYGLFASMKKRLNYRKPVLSLENDS